MLKPINPVVIKHINDYKKLLFPMVKASKGLNIDFSEVLEIDSAGIAFLLELKGLADDFNCHIIFHNLNQRAQKLCQLYKIDPGSIFDVN